MKHIHGIEVRLTDDKGRLITEAAASKRTDRSLLRFNGQVGSRNIHLKPGQRFKVAVTVHRNFKFYAAKGVKIVIVADGVYAGDVNGAVTQRYGLWWIDERDVGRTSEFVIEGFTVWNRRRASREEFTDFLTPEVHEENETTTTNWITEEQYCANEGCIAVFVERGSLVEEDEEAGISLGDRSRMVSPIPIRYDEFLSLNSNNAFPYVFEFRNSEKLPEHRSAEKNDTFGGIHDVRDVVDSDYDEIVYDTDHEMESESEDEAEATDGGDSESEDESEIESEILSESDMDSDISEESYTSSPRRRGRKRKARSPVATPQRKRPKTTAEKNAEADAGNATFASSGNKKNRDADATNASMFGRRSGIDRDDEERDAPWIKKEPGVKQERCDSVQIRPPQRSTAEPAASTKGGNGLRMARRSIVDLTLEDSEDEDADDHVKSGIKSIQKKLDGVAKNLASIKSKRVKL